MDLLANESIGLFFLYIWKTDICSYRELGLEQEVNTFILNKLYICR